MRLVWFGLGAIAASLATACGPESKDGCKDSLVAGDLVITEVFADYQAPTGGTGADEGKEWFEVYNAGDRPIELEGLTIIHSRPDGMSPKSHVVDDVTIAPGQYMTFGNSTQDLLPAYIDYGYSADLGDLYNSDGGRFELKCGTSLIDGANYDSVKPGKSRQLTSSGPPDYTANDNLDNWCEAKDTEFESNNFGTPGGDNDCQPVIAGQCSDGNGMRDAVRPQAGQLVITEFLANPAGTGTDATHEWFEVMNISSAPFDLNGLGLKGNAAAIDLVEAPDCKSVSPGGFAILAHGADSGTNGGLPAVAGTFDFALAQSNGSITVLDGMTPLDSIAWTTGIRDGVARALDPDLADVASNDTPGNFCDGTMPYGTNTPQDLGTPGAANAQCAMMPPAGMCDAGGMLRPIVKPLAGQLVITEFLADPAGTDTTKEWFEIANTGATPFDVNGLTLARAGMTGTTIASPTCITVAGGAYALFARSNDPAVNGMLPAVDATFGFALVQTTGDVEVRDGLTILDAITWPSSTSGVASQLDPDQLTTTGNDLPANFCPGTTPYGDNTNQGTPKAANNQCP